MDVFWSTFRTKPDVISIAAIRLSSLRPGSALWARLYVLGHGAVVCSSLVDSRLPLVALQAQSSGPQTSKCSDPRRSRFQRTNVSSRRRLVPLFAPQASAINQQSRHPIMHVDASFILKLIVGYGFGFDRKELRVCFCRLFSPLGLCARFLDPKQSTVPDLRIVRRDSVGIPVEKVVDLSGLVVAGFAAQSCSAPFPANH